MRLKLRVTKKIINYLFKIMNVKVNDKITWKDKYGRLLPGIVTSLDKYDDVPDLDLNGCLYKRSDILTI